MNLTITFGLVSAPVKLEAGAREDRISLKQIAPDGSGVEQKLFSKKSGQEVQRADVRRGFEAPDGSLVELTEAELEAIAPKKSTAVAIESFIPADSVDPITFNSSHYLRPDKSGPKPYALLFAAMRDKKLMALARVSMYGTESMAVIRPTKRGLVLHTLFWSAEVRAERESTADMSTVNAQELELAGRFIEALTKPTFEANLYRDEYALRLRSLIDSKTPAAVGTHGPAAAQPDIMEVLLSSLKALGKETEPAKQVRRRKPVVAAPKPSLLEEIVAASEVSHAA